MRQYPEEVSYLRQLIDSGRCELSGGLYVQPDENLVHGESLVRQVFYGQKWLVETFGRKAKALGGWNIDSFGHTMQLPQILSKGGIKYVVFARPGAGDSSNLDSEHSEFNWSSPDGSVIFTHAMPSYFCVGDKIGRQRQDNDEAIQEVWNKLKPNSISGNLLALCGCDFTSPPPYLSEAVEYWNERHHAQQCKISTVKEFVDAVQHAQKTVPSRGPKEFQRMFTGCYSSRIGIKQQNREYENMLLTAEKFATMAAIEGLSYPEKAVDDANRKICINQFHDILPGTGIDPIFVKANQRYQEIKKTLSQIITQSLEYITKKANTSISISIKVKGDLIPIVLFNQLSWERNEVTYIDIDLSRTDISPPFRLIDSTGSEVTYQILKDTDDEISNSNLKIAFVAKLPPLGYKTYYIYLRISPSINPEEKITSINDSITIANPALRVTFDSHGNIISLIDKDNEEREIIGAGRYGNQLICQVDNGDEYEYCLGQVLGTTEDYPCTIKMYKGPVMTRLIAESKFTESNHISREVKLYEDLDRIDFRTELDWYGENKAVFLLFPLNFRGEITEEVPYGAIVRPEGRYPVVNWVDYGDKRYGVSLLNRGLPDHYIRNGKIYITLLRSIKNVGVYSKAGPDLECPDACEKGKHTFEYSLYPHSGSWRKAFTYRRGWELNNPIIFYVITDTHSGQLPQEKSYVTVSDNVVLTVMRMCNDTDDGVVLRLYNPEEVSGTGTITLTLNTEAVTKVEETNLLGDIIRPLNTSNHIDFTCNPMAIKTFRAYLNF
jgi:alpha-mannosidase